jgi:hypothetical protein
VSVAAAQAFLHADYDWERPHAHGIMAARRSFSEVAPTGWTTNAITNGGSTDGFAIQWLANSTATALTPGESLTFSFVNGGTQQAAMERLRVSDRQL